MRRPDTYNSEAHRMLVEVVPYSSSELCRLGGFAPPRMSEWKKGRSKPNQSDRQKLEATAGIPIRLWDAPPAARPEAPKPIATTTAPAVESRPNGGRECDASEPVTAEDLALGPAGLERVIHTLESTLDQLTPKDRLTALRDLAHALAVHEKLRLAAAEAREEYLASPAFMADCRALLGAFPASAPAFRDALARVGVQLPEPPRVEVAASREPPADLDDLEDLIAELRVAQALLNGGEPALAWAHTLGLELDLHASGIAKILEKHPARVTGFLDLLVDVDRVKIERELELRLAIVDVRAMPDDVRLKVVSLVTALGASSVAAEIETPCN